MIAAAIALLLRPLHWFSETAHDPVWKWPLWALVVSVSALITYPVEHEWKRRHEIKEKRRQEDQRLKQVSEALLHLSPGEKQILKDFVSSNSKVRNLDSYGDVASLVHQGFLAQLEEIKMGFSYYRITEDLWIYLRENPDILK